MSPHIKIFNQRDRVAFELPPEFNSDERKQFFALPKWANEVVGNLKTSTNKVGFVLQFGYFKAVNKFFGAKKFHRKDVEFIVRRLQCSLEEINLEKYSDATFLRYQEIILENLGFQKFDEQTNFLLTKEALSLSSNQIKPRFMFMSLIDFLKEKRVEIPKYYSLTEIITQALRSFEKELLASVEKHVSPQEKLLLNELLEGKDLATPEGQQILPLRRYDTEPYKITLLKKFHQSTRPAKIKKNLKDLNCLQTLFKELESVITKLQLTPETIQYYAQIVLKAQVFQISRRDDRKYIHLISFVIHQYYRLNDLLTETILQAVQSSVNTGVREHKEIFYETRKSRHQAISNLINEMNQQLTTLQKIEETIRAQLPDAEKLKAVETLLTQTDKPDYTALQERLTLLEKESRRVIKNDDYYNILESRSVKLQNRVSEIIKRLEFSATTSSERLFKAIEYYRSKDGDLADDAPRDFLDSNEQAMVFDSNGKFRISLYKVLLFEKVADGIKSGSLNLRNSYRYRAFDDYLIRKDVWRHKRDALLERAGLTAFANFQEIEPGLRQTLHEQYVITNENIQTGKNKFATVNADGILRVVTPKIEKDEQDTISDLFPNDRYIPLFEILSTINKFSRFTDSFEHWQIKHNRKKPDARIFFAGIMGYGCNIGIQKIAKISRHVRRNELENTVNWYFSAENLNNANDRILEMVDSLELPVVFKRNLHQTHTSSDGQKFNIAVDSLNANYSYKYCGKDKGVSVYGFIDESHRLFYSTVISPAEREAAYVIDGLMHNEVVQSDIHSTDTHGYSEIIFGVTHLLGISFAPRIKNFKKQYLYNFRTPDIGS